MPTIKDVKDIAKQAEAGIAARARAEDDAQAAYAAAKQAHADAITAAAGADQAFATALKAVGSTYDIDPATGKVTVYLPDATSPTGWKTIEPAPETTTLPDAPPPPAA